MTDRERKDCGERKWKRENKRDRKIGRQIDRDRCAEQEIIINKESKSVIFA